MALVPSGTPIVGGLSSNRKEANLVLSLDLPGSKKEGSMTHIHDDDPIVVRDSADRHFSFVGVEVVRWTGVILTVLVVAYIITHWFGLSF